MDKNNISLYNKLKIKFITDFIIVGTFFVVLAVLSFYEVAPMYTGLCIALFFVIYLIKTIFMKRWVFSSFNQTLQKDLELTQESIMDMIDVNGKQRDILVNYSKLTELFKNFGFKIKNFSAAAQGANAKVLEKTKQTINFADESYSNIQSSIDKMKILHEQIKIIAKLILELSEHIEQIASTVSVVENIAEQTNMLALNTAVEAARAGEHGKGFAVVAGEIRKLADESKQATHKIAYLINSIQQVANSTVLATEQGANEIELTVKIVQNMEETANNLSMAIKDIQLNIENISDSISSQSNLPVEAEDIIKEFEKNTVLSAEMLDKSVESINLLNQASESFNQTILENKN